METINSKLFGTLRIDRVVSTTGLQSFTVTDPDGLYSRTVFAEDRKGNIDMFIHSDITGNSTKNRVENPDRFGTFSFTWVTNFYSGI